MSFYIETSGKREIYTRKYLKFQEALTIVSAVLNFMKFLCGLVVSLVGDKIYFQHLINSLLFGVGKEGNYSSSSFPSAVNEKDKEKCFNYMEIKKVLFFSKSESRGFIGNKNENVCRKIVNNDIDNVNDNNADYNQMKSCSISMNNRHIIIRGQTKYYASSVNDNNDNDNNANNVRKGDEESCCRNK